MDTVRFLPARVLRNLVVAMGVCLIAAELWASSSTAHSSADAGANTPEVTQATAAQRKGVIDALGQLPLHFIENWGQFNEAVAYYVQGSDKTIFYTPDGITFALTERDDTHSENPRDGLVKTSIRPRTRRWVVKLDLLDTNPNLRPRGEEPLAARISYFRGGREDWKTGLSTYRRLRYPELWPGIDLVYEGAANQLKYQFEVKPGADPSVIRLAYRGATDVTLTDAGSLEVSTPVGGFSDKAPVVYQEIEDKRVPVEARFTLEKSGPDTWGVGFHLGAYYPKHPLIIDPVTFVYQFRFGGSSNEYANDIAVDRHGNAYVIGTTSSTDSCSGGPCRPFPIAVGPDLTYNDRGDAFVAKLSADASELVYAGYIGGSDQDVGQGIAVDQEGNAYVTGHTASSAREGFPVVVGPDLTFNGVEDAFVAKVSADGTHLIYAGYIGGRGGDGAYGIATDQDGNAYVAGATLSSEKRGFPVTVGPDLTYNGHEYGGRFGGDAFVAKVTADGTELAYAGYIGGERDERTVSGIGGARGIAVDQEGCAYVVGATQSSEADGFPVTMGPDLTYNGGEDAFVAKVSADGTQLEYAGYIGGERRDGASDIAVDQAGNAYVVGGTDSSETEGFPVFVGPDLTYNSPGVGSRWYGDAFVAKVNADGMGLEYAGYIGGRSDESGNSIAVDASGNAYVGGGTFSSASTFPVKNAPDLIRTDLMDDFVMDGFVAKVRADGSELLHAGYTGGEVTGIAVDRYGSAYLTKFVDSDTNLDAFVDKIGVIPHPCDTDRDGDYDRDDDRWFAIRCWFPPPPPYLCDINDDGAFSLRDAIDRASWCAEIEEDTAHETAVEATQ